MDPSPPHSNGEASPASSAASPRFPRFSLTRSSHAPQFIRAAFPSVPLGSLPAGSTVGTQDGLQVSDCPVFPLGLGDHITPREVTTEVLFMFPSPPLPFTSAGAGAACGEVMPFALLRASLSFVLSWWPLLSGRVVQDAKTARLSVLLNDRGCVWVEAECTGLTVLDLVPLAHRKEGQQQGEAPSNWIDDVPEQLYVTSHANRVELGYPGLMVQATRAECGGVLLAVWMDHALHDAEAYFFFVQAWAATTAHLQRTGQLPSRDAPPFKLPLHDRALVDASVAASASTAGGRDEEKEAAKPCGEQRPPVSFAAASRGTVIHFTPQQLSSLKAKLTDALRLLSADSQPGFVSTLDALLAHLWSVLNEARRVQPSAAASVLAQTFNARPRLSPPLPATYSGSVWLPSAVSVPASAASEHNPRSALHFAQRGAALRLRIQQLSDASYLASLLSSWKAVEPIELPPLVPLVYLGEALSWMVTSWMQFPVFAADFGWGRPQSMTFHLPSAGGNLLAVLPSPTQQGVDVWVGQPLDAHERMEQLGRIYDFDYD